MWRKVNVDRVGALTKSIDYHGTKLENLTSHVATSSTESSPVGKDHDWKAFLLKVTNGLSSLVRRIREQHLTCLGLNRLTRVGISRIGRNHTVNQTSLDGNGTHWDTSETTTSDNNTLTPSSEVFFVTSLIEESRHILRTSEHETRIVWSGGRTPFNITVNGISTLTAGWNSTDFLGNETEPFENLRNTLLIITNLEVRDSVGDHNLGTTKLILRGVNLPSEQLVQGGIASQNNRPLLHLDHTLSKTDKVGSDSNTTSGNVTESKNLVVSLGGLASNLTTSLKILHTNTVFSSNDIVKSPAIIDLMSNDSSLRECLVVFVRKVQVVKALGWILLIGKLDLELWFELIDKTDTGSSITREIDTRQVVVTSVLRGLVENFVLLDSKRTTLYSDIIGNYDNFATLRILGRLHLYKPGNHSNLVGSNRASSEEKFTIGALKKLLRLKQLRRHACRVRRLFR
mmetsp:Transcript_26783/g.48514  ORF Transcript_26783/g.48514 Transcript_26783/m.48514 type:complete len:457 (-) Transcript_26783:952-2322(-)